MRTLGDRIVKAGDELRVSLQHDPQYPSIISLRKLRHYCAGQFLEASSKYDRFWSFFVCSFIDDVFFNFGGDTPYDEELHKVRTSLYERIADTFCEIGEAFAENRSDELVKTLSDLAEEYSNRISFLNKS